jgi:hypothetical protein
MLSPKAKSGILRFAKMSAEKGNSVDCYAIEKSNELKLITVKLI